MSYHVAIISAGRPGNVPAMLQHVAEFGEAHWYVPEHDAPDYVYAGVDVDLVEASGGLCASRNAALDYAATAGLPCVQLSDDLRRVELSRGRTRADVEPIGLYDAVGHLSAAMVHTGAQLAGVAPTANPYFSRQRIHQAGFIVGDLCLVAPGCPLRFDEGLPLKEDYDYTLQHLAKYGLVARCDDILATFQHRTNKGGAVAVRTPELEEQAIARLMARWPRHLRANPRRENELLLRWRP